MEQKKEHSASSQNTLMRLFRKTKQTLTRHTRASLVAASMVVSMGAAATQIMPYNTPVAAVVALLGVNMAHTSYAMRRRRQHLDYLTQHNKPNSIKPALNRVAGQAATALHASFAATQAIIAALPESQIDPVERVVSGIVLLAPTLLLHGADAYEALCGAGAFKRKAPRSHALMEALNKKPSRKVIHSSPRYA